MVVKPSDRARQPVRVGSALRGADGFSVFRATPRITSVRRQIVSIRVRSPQGIVVRPIKEEGIVDQKYEGVKQGLVLSSRKCRVSGIGAA